MKASKLKADMTARIVLTGSHEKTIELRPESIYGRHTIPNFSLLDLFTD